MSDFQVRKPFGVLLALASYGMHSFHYATLKWLGNNYSLWQLIFIRSVLTLAITVAVSGSGTVAAAAASPRKISTVMRAATQIASIWWFYTALASMSLAEVTTIYSAAPVITVVLAIFVLGERVRGFRWLAVALGFAGTAIAANPGGAENPVPALMALGAGAAWALTVVLTRKSGARDSSSVQLLTTGIVFILLSASLMTWKNPASLFDCIVMLALGIQIYLAQYFFFEACRFAPASVVGPIEYSGLVWACILGFVIFADIPTAHVLIGAVLVAVGGIALSVSTRGEGPVADPEVESTAPSRLVAGLIRDSEECGNS
jgi:drug/metabolite transporter (DMT)-like permease